MPAVLHLGFCAPRLLNIRYIIKSILNSPNKLYCGQVTENTQRIFLARFSRFYLPDFEVVMKIVQLKCS